MSAPSYSSYIKTGRTTRVTAGTPLLGVIDRSGSINGTISYLRRLELTVATVGAAPSELFLVSADTAGTPDTAGVNGVGYFGQSGPLSRPASGLGMSSGTPAYYTDWTVLPTIPGNINARVKYGTIIVPNTVGERISLDFDGGIPLTSSVTEPLPLLLWNNGAGNAAIFDFNLYFG